MQEQAKESKTGSAQDRVIPKETYEPRPVRRRRAVSDDLEEDDERPIRRRRSVIDDLEDDDAPRSSRRRTAVLLPLPFTTHLLYAGECRGKAASVQRRAHRILPPAGRL